ncbi:unnamed protein product [Tuber aestivum]|uniref:rRNA adenine N(6)-methyltransferase n=1 Tax=Tuber aestivum TaxID=59557 RepID=A0A292Q0N2_9PEZI|nr:unnamed protein product [Tuber aestivum]
MAAASIFRKSADECIPHLRLLLSSSRRRGLPPSLINWQTCGPIIDKLNLLSYKEPTIIDMNPGPGIFSAALHERLQPKQHILLEPIEIYGEGMREFQKTYKNSWYIPLDGYDWNTYNQLFSDKPPPPPWPDGFPTPNIQTAASGDINSELLFVGNMGKSVKSERLIAQFVSCCALGSWVQRYGRVRFLLWVPDSIRDKYLPRSIAARARPAATAEAIVDITEIATSNLIRQGRGFQKLPTINLDNVDVEENKPIISKRQETKLVVREKLVEAEIKRLVKEEMKLPKKGRGRPTKQSAKEREELKKTIARVRKAVEAIRDGKKPKPLANLSPEEHGRLLERYDEIRRAFGYKTSAEIAAEEKERKQKRRLPKSPGRPRKLPQRSDPATTAELTAIEDKIRDSPGLWVQGMEHPPWYYMSNKKALRNLATSIATTHPALRVDPRVALQPENIHAITTEAAGAGDKGGGSAARAWEEYDEQWSRRNEVRSRAQGREDEIYAVHNKLLNAYNRPFEPFTINPAEDFYPHTPMTLLEITPKVPHPFFSPSSLREREDNWLTFEWLVRHLFVLRASGVISALRSLAPGAENILADLPPHQQIPPSRRVRCLGTDDLVNLTMAWKRWPFKDPSTRFQQHIVRDPRVTKAPHT